MDQIVMGRNPVCEALRAGRTVNKIYLARGVKPAVTSDIIKLAREKHVPVQNVERQFLDRMAPGAAHQGVIAQVAPYAYAELEDILDGIKNTDPLLVLLDEVTDPHNLGAVIRCADAAGAHGVVIPRRRAAAVTPAVVKSSAGAVEFVPVARVGNMVQTIELLKKQGIWVVGAHHEASQSVWDAPLSGPLAIVVGGEDKGLGRLVREKCDMLVKLPMAGRVNSLNASVAAALVLFEAVRQRSRG
ncbi:23S rRNA (guanosine(2251)-2'-O)-methyltransferase RlmB [Desulfallas thermosapovorans]|uniref:23S rRNA (Guanosine2251-2'-O)-methyltransferase n=1 Tax=Desulfallas thermosapovorans DSM 6562 TaxID=1121431 RepID=A0A5S4ZRE3_9FIRM|nr:23S rRNA (guanosine(2251)-2'-O)-methyltransferase RlmB [Desulfallas thermosapovorans]TYO94657.1 23S rRNA (guanosine2251-2'-O)-methyltransferase [Desulfallas thermosapovorans DSM 6562]